MWFIKVSLSYGGGSRGGSCLMCSIDVSGLVCKLLRFSVMVSITEVSESAGEEQEDFGMA